MKHARGPRRVSRALVGSICTFVLLGLASPPLAGWLVGRDLAAVARRFAPTTSARPGGTVTVDPGYLRTVVTWADRETSTPTVRVVLHHGPVFFGVPNARGHARRWFGLGLLDVHVTVGEDDLLVARHRIRFFGRGLGTFHFTQAGAELRGKLESSHDLASGRLDFRGRVPGWAFIDDGTLRGELTWDTRAITLSAATSSATFGSIHLTEPRLARVRTAEARSADRDVTTLRADAANVGSLGAREPVIALRRGDDDLGPLAFSIQARDVGNAESMARRTALDVHFTRAAHSRLVPAVEALRAAYQALPSGWLSLLAGGRSVTDALAPADARTLRDFVATGPSMEGSLTVEYEDGADLRTVEVAGRYGFAHPFDVPPSLETASETAVLELRVRLPELLGRRLIVDGLRVLAVLGRAHGEPTAEGVEALLEASAGARLLTRNEGYLSSQISLTGTGWEGMNVLGAPLDRERLAPVRLRWLDLTEEPIDVTLAAVGEGALSDAMITAVVANEAPSLRRCAREGRREAGGEVSAQLDAVLVVDATGAVTEVRLDAGAAQPGAAESCFRPVLMGLRFPATTGPTEAFVNIRYGEANPSVVPSAP